MPTQKTFWQWVGGLATLELLSWAVYRIPNGMTVAFMAAVLVGLLVAWKKPAWLVLGSVAELVVGGKGYLLYAHVGGLTISLREILFLLLVIRFGYQVIRRWSQFWQKKQWRPVVALSVWVAAMVLWGVARGNSIGTVWLDANAFLALAYVPLWWVSLTAQPHWQAKAVNVVFAGATIIGLKSLVLVGLFGHNLALNAPLYHWIRDTGIGEITFISGNVYRVFLQSQIYSVFVLIVVLSEIVRGRAPKWWWVPLMASALGVYISLSRSFWLGLGVAMVVMIVWLMRHAPNKIWRVSFILPVAIIAWLLSSWSTNFPSVLGHGQVNPLLSRLTSDQSAQASTARVNQIRPLLRAIQRHPVIGSGFGTAVTYFSTDPRVHGWRTTTAFELGYLDLWLKLGLVGLTIFAAWLWLLVQGSWRKQELGWLAAIVALAIVHLTSPYLNHPLGLSWLALGSLFLYA